MNLFTRKKLPPVQTTFVYCPVCHVEQCANDCFLEDTDLVRYVCVQCGTTTEWNFDCPVPILIRTYRVEGLRIEDV